MKRASTYLIILALLLLGTGSALAMTSPNFHLDWFVPMTGGGGGQASSTHYAANFTVGQTVIGTSASQHYGTRLGYWQKVLFDLLNFLPFIVRN
jgi:hypothetical protein